MGAGPDDARSDAGRPAGRALGVVVILGLPGAGKTTLARALAERCCARLVSRDAIRDAMFRPCSLTDEEKAAAFAALLGAVATNCALGRLSIVEGMPFSHDGEYEAVADAAAAHRRAALPILLRIDPAVAARRIAAQRAAGEPGPVDRDAALPHRVHRRFRIPPPATVELDACLESGALVDAAAEAIAAERRGR